jgi:hypothetical protein
MAKKFLWKIWLRLNALTKDVDNDYIAEVSTAGDTKHNEDIAKAIKEEGSELQVETLLDILNRGDRWRRKYLLNGSSTQSGNFHISPRVLGGWLGILPVFNPKKHKITFDAVPTADFRKEIDEEVGVEILGKKADGGAVIGMVTGVVDKPDGSIAPGDDIIITGEKIKIAPADEAGLGVFFVSETDEKPLDYPMTENNPKRIVCRVPNLQDGTYTLKIVTRFSSSSVLLKEPRTIVYETPIVVKS